MQAAETRAGSDAMSGGYAMYGQCRLVRRVIWKSRAQRGMWSVTVVMRNPLRENRPQVPFVERNHPIETLAPYGPDEALTIRVRLRCPHQRLQHVERHRPKGLVHGWREDAIAIVDQETIGAIQRQTVPELLDRCTGISPTIPGRNGRTVRVRPARHRHTPDRLKGGRHHDEEVAGEHGAGMIVGGTSPTIVLIGRRDLGAVTACSVAPCAATPSDQASRGAPPRYAPHPTFGYERPYPR
jgi:hypothetical protein